MNEKPIKRNWEKKVEPDASEFWKMWKMTKRILVKAASEE